jgi:hypothetical protein
MRSDDLITQLNVKPEGADTGRIIPAQCDHPKTEQSPSMRGLTCVKCGELVFPDVAAYYLDQLKTETSSGPS